MICRSVINSRDPPTTKFQTFFIIDDNEDLLALIFGIYGDTELKKLDAPLDIYQKLHPDIDYEFMSTHKVEHIDQKALPGMVSALALEEFSTTLSLEHSIVKTAYLSSTVAGLPTSIQQAPPANTAPKVQAVAAAAAKTHQKVQGAAAAETAPILGAVTEPKAKTHHQKGQELARQLTSPPIDHTAHDHNRDAQRQYPTLIATEKNTNPKVDASGTDIAKIGFTLNKAIAGMTISDIKKDQKLVNQLYDYSQWFMKTFTPTQGDKNVVWLITETPEIVKLLVLNPFNFPNDDYFTNVNQWLAKQGSSSDLAKALTVNDSENKLVIAQKILQFERKSSEDPEQGYKLPTIQSYAAIAQNKYLRGGGEVETYFNKWITNASGPNLIMCANFLFNADVRGYTDSNNVFVFKPFSEWNEAIGKDFGNGFKMITNFYYNFVSNNVRIYKNGKAHSKLIGNVWSSIAHVPTRQQVIGSANVIGMPTQLNILAPPVYDLFRSTLPLMAIVSEKLTEKGKTISKKSNNKDYNKALHTPAVLTGGGNNNYKTIVTSLLGEEFGQYANMTGGAYGVIVEPEKFDGNYIVDKLEKEYELRVNQLKFKGINVDPTDHQNILNNFKDLRKTVNEIKNLLSALQNAVVNKKEDDYNGPLKLKQLTQDFLDKAEDLKNSYTNTQQAIILIGP